MSVRYSKQYKLYILSGRGIMAFLDGLICDPGDMVLANWTKNNMASREIH